MYLNMNDFVPMLGPGAPDYAITGSPQMFGMGDYIPGEALGPYSPLDSIYGRQQMFGMGDLTESINQAKAELEATRQKRQEAASRLQELKSAGAQVLESVTGAVSAAPPAAKAGMGAGTLLLLGVGGYFLAKQMKWIK